MKEVEPKYIFHKDDCILEDLTPFNARDYYNFCIPFTTKEGKKKTVETLAQRLDITDKVFELKDIIYLR